MFVTMESLEQRQFLSASIYGTALPPDVHAPLVAVEAPLATTSSVKIVGDFVGTAKIDGPSAKLILKITSQSGSRIKARLYSSDWGAFDVNLTGTCKSGRLSLTGHNNIINVKKFDGVVTLKNQVIDVSFSATQMGINIKAKVKLAKVKRAPALVIPKVPQLAERYDGRATPDGGGGQTDFSLLITRQEGGHIWAILRDSEGDSRMSGVILKNKGLHLEHHDGGEFLEINGTVLENGNLDGDWSFRGGPGDNWESGDWEAQPA